jgi:phosphonate transport system permease protein
MAVELAPNPTVMPTPTPPPSERMRERLLDPKPHLTPKKLLLTALLVIVYLWGLDGTNASPSEFWNGIPYVWRFLTRIFPPQFVMEDWSVAFGHWTIRVPEAVPALIQTIQMAVIGTTLAIVLSIPFGLLAARNVSPHKSVYLIVRFILNMNRAVPDLIIALIFVAAVGLGPFAGVLALAISSIGSTAKMYAESIESIDPAQVAAVNATGASGLQTFMYAVTPQALPMVASYSLLLFEHNVRSASILGIVGAGGIGLTLSIYMALFKYQELLGALLIILVAVTAIDRFSDYIRRKLI